ncbi:MAG: AAA family ATPase [Clostridia bacterium]|nr:MAG: AAA family ATPase [Clostridia bacterium]
MVAWGSALKIGFCHFHPSDGDAWAAWRSALKTFGKKGSLNMQCSSHEELNIAWKSFVNLDVINVINTYNIRPQILESWERSKAMVSPFLVETQVLNDEELQQARKSNHELLRTATKVIKNTIEDDFSHLKIAISDTNGYLLEVFPLEKPAKSHNAYFFVPGANWSEDVIGTTAIGIATVTGSPIDIYGAEHWNVYLHQYASVASPVRDPDSDTVIGIVAILDYLNDITSDTISITKACALSIEESLGAQRSHLRSELSNKCKTMIIETMSDALVAIYTDGKVAYINERCSNILGGVRVGDNLYHVMDNYKLQATGDHSKLLNILRSDNDVADAFISVPCPTGSIRCLITARNMVSSRGKIGKLVIMKEISHSPTLQIADLGERTVTFDDLIGEDKAFLEKIEVASKVATTTCNVLLLGESGTGKDMFAQAIHNASPRRNGPFIAVNCAAIPKELLASELFGYSEGAFTGAKKGGSPGKFIQANHGTMFMDEIGDMPLEVQSYLLRALEEKTVTPLAARQPVPVDIRIIAATNRDLLKEVSLGNFRQDLFFRLNTVTIDLPPLRERRSDIIPLLEYLTKKMSIRHDKTIKEIDKELVKVCLAYPWPGNVRELQNAIERSIILASDLTLSKQNLPPYILNAVETKVGKGTSETENQPLKASTRSVQKDIISSYLARHHGNKSLTAKELGISRSTLYRKLKE